MLNFLYVLIAALLIAGCSAQRTEAPHLLPTRITVRGDRFVDDQGREVVLNGINVVSKSKEEQYLFQAGPEFYGRLRDWGINCIRFIVIWDGLEPAPGQYDEAYLQEIDKRIQWAADHDLFVVLDMHQDLYSVKYSDGAPAWATLDEGQPHEAGAVWSDAYMISAAVQTAFDNFWANAPAPDGIGLQDHYAKLWQHLARRYAGNPTVVGYDIMNEPFPGSAARQALPALLGAYGQLVFEVEGKQLSEEQLLEIWGSATGRAEALQLLSSRDHYRRVIDALADFNRRFETEQLQPMYQRVADAIRQVDTSHVLFLEHSYFSNTGVATSIERTRLPDGRPDPRVAYAPHAYDLVTDTENAAAASSDRLAFIFERLAAAGARLGMPVWLGEWGAYYRHGEAIVPVARRSIALIEQHRFGQAYWSYDPGLEELAYFQEALLRPYPAYTNGQLLRYRYDFDAATLTVEWKEDRANTAPTLVYAPNLSRLDKGEGIDRAGMEIRPFEKADAGWIVIPARGKGETREVRLRWSE